MLAVAQLNTGGAEPSGNAWKYSEKKFPNRGSEGEEWNNSAEFIYHRYEQEKFSIPFGPHTHLAGR